MPVFATPNSFWHYFFSDMRKLDRNQRAVIAFLIFLGCLTLTLSFFSYPSPTSGKVSWTGFKVAESVLTKSTANPLPRMYYQVDPAEHWFGVWSPVYVVAFAVAYGCLLICGIAAAAQPLRRILRIAGPLGALAALFCTGRSRLYVFEGADGVSTGVGPWMLALILAALILVADAKVDPD
jgi:hypothetical protein